MRTSWTKSAKVNASPTCCVSVNRSFCLRPALSSPFLRKKATDAKKSSHCCTPLPGMLLRRRMLLRSGIPPRGQYLCFALRPWKGFAQAAPLFGKAARYAYETYGLTPVFFSVEKHQDPEAGRLAARDLGDVPHYFLDDAGGAGTIIGALSRMEAVVSMRLHALIFAAGQGIPLAGVVYDPKVSAFLRYIGQENFTDLETLTERRLREMIDRAAAEAKDPALQAAAVARLREIEGGNLAAARKLLGL